MNWMPETQYCPQCHSILDHYGHGTMVCYRCGFVTNEPYWIRRLKMVNFDFRILCGTIVVLALILVDNC